MPYCGQDGQRLEYHSSRVHFGIAVCTSHYGFDSCSHNLTAHEQRDHRVILTTIRLGQHSLAFLDCFLILPFWSELCVRFRPCCLKGPTTDSTQKGSVDRRVKEPQGMVLHSFLGLLNLAIYFACMVNIFL